MKKQLVVITLIGALLIAGGASANWGRGGGSGYGQQGAVQYQQLDAESRAKITLFQKDNQALRKEMVMKQAEKRALLSQAQPDVQAVAKVAGELFDLRTSLQEKAELAGVAQFMGHGRMGMGPGRKGNGRMGMGRMPCWGPMANIDGEPVPQQ